MLTVSLGYSPHLRLPIGIHINVYWEPQHDKCMDRVQSCNIQQYMNYIILWLGKVATWKLPTRKGQKPKVE